MTDPEPGLEPIFAWARRHLSPKLRDSAVVLSLSTGEPDPKFCLELGMAIVLDKPILLVVPTKQTLAPNAHLLRVADAVLLDWDPQTAEGQARLREAIIRLVPEMDADDGPQDG